MSSIIVSNLTFSYDNSWENVFENVSFSLDTSWKLGLVGRNGKGKTTLLKLFMNEFLYTGKILSNIKFNYFPFAVKNREKYTYEIVEEIVPGYEDWKLNKEISLLGMESDILYREFKFLSKGEQTKILLASLFLKDDNFLLIDEPTNHLDYEGRKIVSNYLKQKKGFIIVSHDRNFLDECVDHIMAITKTNIEIRQGNFSSWWENKQRQDNFEKSENDKLKKDIKRLEESARQVSSWADKTEKGKYHIPTDRFIDKGFVGHKAAKMMGRAKSMGQQIEREIEKKSKLMKDVEFVDDLKLKNQNYRTNILLSALNLSVSYNGSNIFDNVSFQVERGDRLQIKGKNGSGKSSIIKLILGHNKSYDGILKVPNDLRISYVSQDTSFLSGTLKDFVVNNNIDESLFKTILKKLDFTQSHFDMSIENYSEGQKKKILLAKSLSESADLYIWDEPLNYIDVFSRMQIEDVILRYNPTMIFVEHDEIFGEKIATKKLILE